MLMGVKFTDGIKKMQHVLESKNRVCSDTWIAIEIKFLTEGHVILGNLNHCIIMLQC